MKLLFDHNLSPSLVRVLADLHPDSSHVFLLGLGKADDAVVRDRARLGGYAIVTKDSDFRGFPPKVIRVGPGNRTTQQIEGLFRQKHQAVIDFEVDPASRLLSLF